MPMLYIVDEIYMSLYIHIYFLNCHISTSDLAMNNILCTIAYMFSKTNLKLEDYSVFRVF